MLQQPKPDDYVLATGETHTIREFVELSAKILGWEVVWRGRGLKETGVDKKTGRTLVAIDPRYFRPAEVDLLVGDARKARRELGWKPSVTFEQLVEMMVKSDLAQEAKNAR